MVNELRVGVTGYSAKKFDRQLALDYLVDGFNTLAQEFPDRQIVVVSGLTNLGVPALAYEEAVRRGYRTAGIACAKAEKYDCFPCDEKRIVGENWGEESSTFLGDIAALIRVGGGVQALEETEKFKETGKRLLEYDVPLLP